MRKTVSNIALLSALLTCAVLFLAARPSDNNFSGGDQTRVERGFRIAPVPLKLNWNDRNQVREVGLGSYLVNGVAGCNSCHTCPSFAAGGNPFAGQPTIINAANYLAGGVHFGPFVSANLTPDASGKPEGHTFEEFQTLFQTGHESNGDLLQVMPWPTYHNMTTQDVHAIYSYLKAIPSAQPGTACSGPDQGAQ